MNLRKFKYPVSNNHMFICWCCGGNILVSNPFTVMTNIFISDINGNI